MPKLLKLKTGVDTTTDDIVVKKANQLTTARLINGVPFDGTQDINIDPGISSDADRVDGYHANINNVPETVVVRDINNNINVISAAVDYVSFNVNTQFLSIPEVAGNLWYDEENNALAIKHANGTLEFIGEQLYFPNTNNTSGENIPKGYFIMATGANGDRVTIAKAVTNGTVDPQFMIGVAATDIMIDSEYNKIITQGYVQGVNTSAWPVGTVLYPDPTIPGWWTSTKPIAPALKTSIAMVIKQNAGSGILMVRMNLGSVLGETDTNVQFTNISDKDLMSYDNVDGIWRNKTFAQLGLVDTQYAADTYQNKSTELTGFAALSTTGLIKRLGDNQYETITDNSNDWNTAFGWGNHASAGYLTEATANQNYQAADADLSAIAALNGNNGFLKKTGTNTWGIDSNIYALVDHNHNDLYYSKAQIDTSLAGYVPTSTLGQPNGVATLDSAGQIPTNFLPGFINDVLEYASVSNFPTTGQAGVIYVAIDTHYIYRWSGTGYVLLGGGTAAGTAAITVSTTAPVGTGAGSLWWNSADGMLKIYYEDGDSGQWVDAVNSQGKQGIQGIPGDNGTVQVGSVSTKLPNQSATVTNSGTSLNAVLDFGIPRGSNVSVGTTTTGNPGTNASVDNTGSNGDAILNFTIPRGSNVSVGTTTTGNPGTNASVDNTGSNGDAILNFTIPRGTGITNVVDNGNNTMTITYGDSETANVSFPTSQTFISDFSGTITSGSWSGSNPFTKAVTVSGILSTDTPIIDLNMSTINFADIAATQTAWGKIYRAVTSTNTITFYSTESISIALPFIAKVVR